MEKQDKNIVCKDCGNTFVFTVREQEFFEEKGFSDPVRFGFMSSFRTHFFTQLLN